MTRKVSPVTFLFANNQMFFKNLTIEMAMSSRVLQNGHNLYSLLERGSGNPSL